MVEVWKALGKAQVTDRFLEARDELTRRFQVLGVDCPPQVSKTDAEQACELLKRIVTGDSSTHECRASMS